NSVFFRSGTSLVSPVDGAGAQTYSALGGPDSTVSASEEAKRKKVFNAFKFKSMVSPLFFNRLSTLGKGDFKELIAQRVE
ncbi:hypothetical protein, partial [Citrobacter braakii]|uniref:hypothetical protein n=1 Tax=Citrobacter braakii TaxID=57706 RepID=UPI001C8B947F